MEQWTTQPPVTCITSFSCQKSISRRPERDIHDTILTQENRRRIRYVNLTRVLRRFLLLFCWFYILLIFNTIHSPIFIRIDILQSETARNTFKTVILAASLCLFCSLTLTILQRHFDYFAPQDKQNDTAMRSRQHTKTDFLHRETCFSGIRSSARKYQPPCQMTEIYHNSIVVFLAATGFCGLQLTRDSCSLTVSRTTTETTVTTETDVTK